MISRRRVIAGLAAAGAPLSRVERAIAQLTGNAFIISGFPAGGMGDLVSRPLADKMRGTYAGNVLVESKVGAGGRLAAEFVKRANPDGLTILQIPSSIMVLYPHIYKNLAYDPFTDFTPVTNTVTYVFSFTASAALPPSVQTVANYVTWAKANPNISSYGIPAAGSALHFAGILLQRAADIRFEAVPYRGGAPRPFRAASCARSGSAVRNVRNSSQMFRPCASRAFRTSPSRNGWGGSCRPKHRPRLSTS